jgi:hypothetical protein
MPTLIIGSTAMERLGVIQRPAKDVDTFSDNPESGWDNFWHPSFAEFVSGFRYATLDELYTIKVSHSYWVLENGSWDKHMSDIVALKRAGAKIIQPLHDLLYKVWEEKYGRKRVNLQMDKSAFFDDAVKRTFDHDSIHESVAYGEVPIYDSVLVNGQTIAMDMAAIRALDYSEQIKLYREEVYVTALERYVIPSGYKFSPRRAYAMALQKTITSLTKGWSAQFMVENYETFRIPDIDYVAWHKSKAHKLIRLDKQ